MTNTLRSLDPPINTVPDGGPYAGRHRLLNSTVVVQPRVGAAAAVAAAAVAAMSNCLAGRCVDMAVFPASCGRRCCITTCPCLFAVQGTFFVPCQYNQADCHRKLVTERALGVASLAQLAGKQAAEWCLPVLPWC